MMYKITKLQAESLKEEKYQGMKFNPIQDVNGDWFIGEKEAQYCTLHFAFEPVEAEFIPPEPDPIDF